MSTTSAEPAILHWRKEEARYESLEPRVERLEEAVASLCDSGAMEDLVRAKAAQCVQEETGKIRAEFKSAISAQYEDTTYSNLGFFGEIWADITLLKKMIRDHRYGIPIITWVLPMFGLLYVCVFSPLNATFPIIPFKPLLLHLDEVAIIFLALKALGRELRRYRRFLSHHRGGE